MHILTFGYKVNPGGYLEVLENEWEKLGHKIVNDIAECDIIFNLDRSKIKEAYLACKNSKKPFYCCVLDIPVMEGTQFAWQHYSQEMLEFEREVYSECRKVFSISKETSRCLKKYNEIESINVGIPALLNSRFYEPRQRYKYVYYFGRASDPIKRIQILYDAIQGAGIDLYISGAFTENIKSLPGLFCFGHLPRQKVENLVKTAWLVVDPAIWHGLGLQPIEAVLTGTACISADIRVKRDVWGDVLPLFEPDNVGELRDKILSYDYRDFDLARGKKIAEWYLPERVAKRIIREIEE